MKFSRFALLTVLLLGACKDVTNVQKEYISHRNDCRSVAEDRLSVYNHPDTYPMGDRERNNALLALFSECMKGHDWKVAGGPKKDAPKEAPKDATKDAQDKAAAAPAGAYVPPTGYALVPVVPAPATAVAAPALAPKTAPMVNTYPVAPPAPAANPGTDFVTARPPAPAAAAAPIGTNGVIYQRPPAPPVVTAPPISPSAPTPSNPASLLRILEKD